MDMTWLAERPHLAPLVSKMKELLALADAMVQECRAGGASVDYAAFEESVAAQAAEVEAAVHQTTLASLDIDAPFVRVWGKDYRRVHRAERTYATMAGPVTVPHTLYRQVGARRGGTLDVVGARAGVVDRRWLPRTARAMAHLLGQGTSREAQTTSAELLRLPYSRSSFERVGHAVGAVYGSRRSAIESRLIEAAVVPAQAASVSVAIDRVSVPMEEPVQTPSGGRRTTALTAQERRQVDAVRAPRKLDRRTKAVVCEMERAAREGPQAKVARRYRMAYCATVSLHDAQGKALQTIRYGRMPPAPNSLEATTHREVHRLMERLGADVRALRAQRPDLSVVLLADGAPELWRLFERHLNERTLGVTPTHLVDAWHALEYVAAAAKLAEERKRCMPGTFRKWRKLLLEAPDGAQRVLKALHRAGLKTARDDSGKRAVGDAIRYLDKRLSRMAYAAARVRGLPIGSGTVEATCKSLVSQRMRRAGSRWKPKTGNEVLQLRALQLSDRWALAMRLTLKPLRKSVRRIERPTRARQAA